MAPYAQLMERFVDALRDPANVKLWEGLAEADDPVSFLERIIGESVEPDVARWLREFPNPLIRAMHTVVRAAGSAGVPIVASWTPGYSYDVTVSVSGTGFDEIQLLVRCPHL